MSDMTNDKDIQGCRAQALLDHRKRKGALGAGFAEDHALTDIAQRGDEACRYELAPVHRFHELKGNRKGTYSVTIRANWRLTFEWEDGAAVRVDLEDYHGN
jgi:hypothetical protein